MTSLFCTHHPLATAKTAPNQEEETMEAYPVGAIISRPANGRGGRPARFEVVKHGWFVREDGTKLHMTVLKRISTGQVLLGESSAAVMEKYKLVKEA